MFRYQREYRAIAFHAASLQSVPDVLGLLPKQSTALQETLENSTDQLEVCHAFYYSRSEFTQGKLLEEAKEKGRRGMARYNMYLFRFAWKRQRILFVAVPFSKMATEVFDALHVGTRGMGLKYHAVDLGSLISCLTNGDGSITNHRLTAAKFDVEGDSAVDRLGMSGDDVVHSRSYKRICEGLRGITLSPLRCRLVYDDHEGTRFGMQVDLHGNYWFRVRQHAVNLAWSEHLFRFLYGEKLMMASPAFPLHRGVTDEGDYDG